MATEAELLANLGDKAMQPHQVVGDQGQITQQRLRDLIELDKYVRTLSASSTTTKRRAVLRNIFGAGRIAPPSAQGLR